MTWNDTVIAHPHLSSTDKLVYHLLQRLGGDTPRSRDQLRILLDLGQRQLRRSRERLQRHGFLSPARSSMTTPADIYDRTADKYDRTADKYDRSPDIYDRSFDAPTRTLWSSSSEEDVLVKTSTPSSSPSPGGTGGEEEEGEEEFLVEMSRLWKTIAPQDGEEPRDWFCTLYREFGPQIPLTVLRQFALGGRTLSQLRHPSSYKSYFACCCRKARQEGLAAPGVPAAAGDFAPDRDPRCLADPPQTQAEVAQTWLTLARAQNAAARQRFQLETERSPQ